MFTLDNLLIPISAVTVGVGVVISATWWLAQQFFTSREITLAKLDEHERKDQTRYEHTLKEFETIKIRLAGAGIRGA